MNQRNWSSSEWLLLAAAPTMVAMLAASGFLVCRWRKRASSQQGETNSKLASSSTRDEAPKRAVWAAIELGGTTARAAIAIDTPDQIIERFQVPTSTPVETLTLLAAWLAEKHGVQPITSLGVATFGPILLQHTAPCKNERRVRFGKTPKLAWQDFSLIEGLQSVWLQDETNPVSQELAQQIGRKIPVLVDTDVNAPALAELAWRHKPHADASQHVLVYVTVGTGVGVGVAINHEPLHGRLHPEGGHIRVARHPADTYPGTCAWHRDCLEGLCCARALADRAKTDPAELATLSDDHPIWNIAAYYLAQLCLNLSCLLAPQWIVLGGGIMQRAKLLSKIQAQFAELDASYLGIEQPITTYIVSSAFGSNAGLVGACALAERAWRTR
ncbi:hypothetical protein CCYA_CCYA18G4488 [Cyanidiococcus yangmingshanensis]|nr:hypothetical protein CCYA_CCYA18G4488 [Cyanidiococcus yangmingshanensis]